MGGPYPQDFIETVRSAGDIVRVVSDYVPLKQAGSRMKGLCPFHQEKTPSFSVDPTNQLFYCFGCQTGGDLFKFVQLYEKVGFGEAIEILAKRFAVPLPKAARVAEGPSDRARAICSTAETFFAKLLADPEAGKKCRAYLEQRGLSDEVRERLRIGYSPDGWEGLHRHLQSKGYKSDDIQTAGLILSRKSGQGHYDRFRDRLIFPIRDIQGRTIAFGGRTLADDDAKYINSPETPAYTKGEHLYGLDQARESIRREGFAVVVEGYLDLAAVVGAGCENVVASLGTAFTPAQARLLARYTERVVVSYDGDSAGAKAAARSLDLLLHQGFDVRVVELPEGQDPDDFIRDAGAAAYGRCLREAPEYIEFLVHREVRSRDMSRADEKVAAVNAVLPHIAKLNNAIERASWATRLADALQIEDGLVMQELRNALRAAQTEIRQRPQSSIAVSEAETRLVSLLLGSEQLRRRWADELDPQTLEGTRVRPIVLRILELTRDGKAVDAPLLMSELEDETDRQLLTQIAFEDQPEVGPNVEDCLWAFQREQMQRQERELLREISKTGRAGDVTGDADDVDKRLMQLQHLARQRDALQ
ncbi:MAG: DNA primase [bacterium]|nr:DNA primase [bacterium]